ncbi:MAG TPA: VTT domain-containing protein [Segetibacter sp.]|nr:VTT domain-containing protein [Segetibacter sp.]
MKQDVINLFNTYPNYAFLFSIGINIVIAVLGVLPSVFLTAANILFFGFWNGTFISFAGESVGAVIAFWLYRAGFKKSVESKTNKYPAVAKLLKAEGKDAFVAIISLRLIPFIPSGIITFTAAIGRVSLPVFFVASSIGKMPAMLIEAYAAYEVTAFNWQGKIILLLVGLYLLYFVFLKKK